MIVDFSGVNYRKKKGGSGENRTLTCLALAIFSCAVGGSAGVVFGGDLPSVPCINGSMDITDFRPVFEELVGDILEPPL
jgi:hypothetical protein